MFRYDPKSKKEVRVINTVQPVIPMWAVLYDSDTNKVAGEQVMCFVAREFVSRVADIESEVKLFPVINKSPGELVEIGEDFVGFLGYSMGPEIKQGDWSDAIRDLKKKLKSKAE